MSVRGVERPKAGRTYKEATAEIQESLQRHLSRQKEEGNGEGGSGSDSDSEPEVSDGVLDSLLAGYGQTGPTDFAKASLADALHSTVCLICISSVKRQEAIWSCDTCYVSFHLYCIQRWAKDSIFQLKQQQEQQQLDHGVDPSHPLPPVVWTCPKCRAERRPNEVPQRYTCYCGKQTDPQFDPWLAAHSCGERCSRQLSNCAHKCLLLCHPGPCPPCPQTLNVLCLCGNGEPQVRRCSDRAWTCGRPCGKVLACGQHACPVLCHGGECPPCGRTSVQSCACGKNKAPRACSAAGWRCETVCGRRHTCGHHTCDLACHSGVCPPCPLSQPRSCPCGKSVFDLPCPEATPTCGDTCGKTLSCGGHTCAERCHRGSCPQCLQMTVKGCRCGSKKKEVLCSKQFTCEMKCKKTRDCRRHPCNRKCCRGACPPCEQVCGRQLSCKNHKCGSRCHQGPCYPCAQLVELKCSCGSTKVTVPCGRERTARPPRCKRTCGAPSNCHHPARAEHLCHRPPCPPCRLMCAAKLACGHTCPVSCHDNVKVTVAQSARPAGPWEARAPSVVIEKKPCPPCEEPVHVPCLGGHEIGPRPCHEAKPASCGRPCGRSLACGNHACRRECHKVKNAPDDVAAGSNCKKCEVGCSVARDNGCAHPCQLKCHPPPCPPCTANIKQKCHCGINMLYRKCSEHCAAGPGELEALLCCQDQCPQLLSCGHRCTKTCHTGPCSLVAECKRKAKMTCPCKRRKEDSKCGLSSGRSLACDDECRALADKKGKEVEQQKGERSAANQEEEQRKQREAELFERRGEGRKRRRNRRERDVNEETPTFLQKYKLFLAALLFVFLSVSAGLVLTGGE